MQFPAPSETFACSDVRKLCEEGFEVSVLSLKGRHRRHSVLVNERRLKDIPIINCGVKEFCLGFAIMVCKPSLFFSVLTWIFKSDLFRPINVTKII